MNKLSVTVCIPTCYGGNSIVRVVESIRNSNIGDICPIYIRADSQPISADIKNKLAKLNVKLKENNFRGSQIFKYKQMLREVRSDIVVFTQDDVRFSPNTLTEITKIFNYRDDITMIGANVLPEPSKVLFERVISVGQSISGSVLKDWNNGDNYLASNGRCLAFRRSWLDKIEIPENIVNTDGYLYFENEKIDGKFYFSNKAIVFNPNPRSLFEQLRQTERFLYSKNELSKYFGSEIKKRYNPPTHLLVKAIFFQFISDPLLLVLYLAVLFLGKIKYHFFPRDLSPFWKVNMSTKSIDK